MKVVITTYTFNAAAKTVDFSGYTNFDEQRLQAIVNITRGVVIYAPGISGKGLTSIAGDVLTLEYDTTAQADTDKLMPLYVEDALPLPTGAATQATLAAILADLQAKADLAETQPVSVQSLPAGLATSANQTSEIALLTSLAAEDFGTETTLAAILAKIIAAPATEAKQDTMITALQLIDNMISGNYAQTKAFADTSGSGGLSISRVISAATTNATSAKGSAGKVYGIIATNINAAVRYLKLYNKASSPTVGTDTPVMTIAIPGNTAGAGIVINFADIGVNFATGIAYAITTGVADSDTGAVAANEIIVQVLYA